LGNQASAWLQSLDRAGGVNGCNLLESRLRLYATSLTGALYRLQ
jgi:hypothetical protein